MKEICIDSINQINVLWVRKENYGYLSYDRIEQKCADLIHRSLLSVFKSADLKHLDENDMKSVLDVNMHRCTNDNIKLFLDHWKTTNENSDVDGVQKKICLELITEYMKKTVDRVFFEYKTSVYGNHNHNYNYGSRVPTPPPINGLVIFEAVKPMTLIGIGVINKNSHEIILLVYFGQFSALWLKSAIIFLGFLKIRPYFLFGLLIFDVLLYNQDKHVNNCIDPFRLLNFEG